MRFYQVRAEAALGHKQDEMKDGEGSINKKTGRGTNPILRKGE